MKKADTEHRGRHLPQGFAFTPEMGARLRELRERARLNITEMAHVMGHRVEYRSYLKKLESGRLRYPTLALVADYLRACRASFNDLSPLLGAYTGRHPVRDPRTVEKVEAVLTPLRGREAERLGVYDRRMSGRLSPEGRVQAAKKQAQAVRERRLLDDLMRDEVNRLGVPPSMAVRNVAYDYAWMVWKAMKLTGGSQKPEAKTVNAKGGRNRGRPRKTREQRLSEARTRIHALAPRILPFKALKHIEAKVTLLYEDMHRVRDMAAGGTEA